ncbi:hypothetical protein [Flavobacterium pectinovorum]|uniref:hypothetical protein n=1 Tax=Flavobacterium pectinovorum TaxID=29533 RepID=UPI001FAE12A2|nr:hypothetical protein [Flavobacterium pectinovorum]MCI9846568.1 hypothetical protein [Flavobacterium pectinovorum]
MNNKLEIKFKYSKQSFEILDEVLFVNLNTAKHKLSYNIPLEDIKKSKYTQKNRDDKFAIGLYLSIFLNVLLALSLIIVTNNAPPLSLPVLYLCLITPFVIMIKNISEGHDEVHLEATKHLYFIYTKKNALEVDHFIEAIYQKQTQFYRKKYFLVDPVLPYNIQYERYIWLYTNDYINDNEYEIIKDDLDKYFNFNPNI